MNREKGSLTVEAALTLPIFIFVIISIAFLIKIAYVQEVIQHAIGETATEISTYSYILSVTGIKDLDSTINAGVEKKAALFNNHLDDIVTATKSLSSMGKEVQEEYENFDIDFSNMEDRAKTLQENIDKILETGEEIFSDPVEEAYSFIYSIGGLAYNDTKSLLLQSFTKLLVRKYISPEKPSNVNRKLEMLNIDGGLKGLDFSQSKFFQDEEDIDIIVRYQLNLALPINVLPDLYIIQRATVKAWLDGK